MTEPATLTSVLDPNNEEIARWRTQAPELLTVAEAFVVADDHDCEIAADHVRTTSGMIKAVKTRFKPVKQSLDLAKKQVTLLETDLIEKVIRADDIFRRKVTDYKVQQRRLADERRRAEEAAIRKQREDEQVAEAARLESMAAATGDEHFRRAAERVLEAPTRPAVVSIAKPAPTKGVTLREETGIVVRDLDAFIQHVATTGEGRGAIALNPSWLRKEAEQRSLRDGGRGHRLLQQRSLPVEVRQFIP